MPWKKRSIQSKKNQKESEDWLRKTCKKRPKFLCDENLQENTANRLSLSGYNAISVYDIELSGKPDEIIYTKAYKTGRILLTHDDDFLDNKKFELKFSTPTIILPSKEFEKALSLALYHIAPYFQVFAQMKVQISPGDSVFYLTRHNTSNGKIERCSYRFRDGDLEEFEKK